MMKKISRRSFLQVCGITAATAALTACGSGKAESKTADAHEAVTFMAPYKEIEAFIEHLNRPPFYAPSCKGMGVSFCSASVR